MPNVTLRFSDRIENYVKYRPGYPPQVPMLARLRRIFDANAENALVSFDYETKVYYARF